MLATAYTAAVLGVHAHLVRVEADTAGGFPRFVMLGLADSAVRDLAEGGDGGHPRGCVGALIRRGRDRERRGARR